MLLLLTMQIHGTDVPGGNVSGIWTSANSPYYVLGDIRVAEGEALVIEPGVQIEFGGQYILRVLGNISAIGAVGDSITVTTSSTNSCRVPTTAQNP